MYEDMNCDDAKEESNKGASKDKHCFKINTRLLQQTKPCFKITLRSSLASKQSVSKTSKALVMLKRVLNLNFEPIINYQIFVINYQQWNS